MTCLYLMRVGRGPTLFSPYPGRLPGRSAAYHAVKGKHPMSRITHTCPWWLTWTFDNPLRRWVQDPHTILSPYVHSGMRIADIGCGMGYFTVALADLAGPTGRVQAVDLQPQQLSATQRRCERAGLVDRVRLVQATPDSLKLAGPLDFILAFAMVHEVADQAGLFRQIYGSCAPKAKVLVCEPKFHVSRAKAEAQIGLAVVQGFSGAMCEDAVGWSWTYVLERTEKESIRKPID